MTNSPVGEPLIPMRPLSLGDLFGSAIAIYKQNFTQFLILGLIPSAVGLGVAIASIVATIAIAVPMVVTGGAVSDAVVGSLIGMGVILVLGTMVVVTAQYTATGLSSVGVVQANRGQQFTVKSLWRDARGLAGRAVALTLVYLALGLVIFGLLGAVVAAVVVSELYWLLIIVVVAAIAVGVIWQARLSLVLQVMGIEGVGPIEAIKRCWKLTAGHGPRIFGMLLLVNMAISVISQTISGLAQGLMTPIADQLVTSSAQPELLLLAGLVPLALAMVVVTQLFTIISLPFVSIFSSVLYMDVRRRKEAEAGLPLYA